MSAGTAPVADASNMVVEEFLPTEDAVEGLGALIDESALVGVTPTPVGSTEESPVIECGKHCPPTSIVVVGQRAS